MTELDKFFGPKPDGEMPDIKPSHFGRYPDVQELCDAFLEEMEWGHDLYTIGQIAAGARDYILAINHDPSLLVRAAKKMKNNKLSIGSPRSCITTAREKLYSPNPDSDKARQRYVTGEFADFWEVDDE